MFWSWNSKAECDFRDLTSANMIIKVMLIQNLGMLDLESLVPLEFFDEMAEIIRIA